MTDYIIYKKLLQRVICLQTRIIVHTKYGKRNKENDRISEEAGIPYPTTYTEDILKEINRLENICKRYNIE